MCPLGISTFGNGVVSHSTRQRRVDILAFHWRSRSYGQLVSSSGSTRKQKIHILFLDFLPQKFPIRTVDKSNSIIQEGLERLVDSFPLLCGCYEDFPTTVFHHYLPQHEGLEHRNKRAALPTFQVMPDVPDIFMICSPVTKTLAFISTI